MFKGKIYAKIISKGGTKIKKRKHNSTERKRKAMSREKKTKIHFLSNTISVSLPGFFALEDLG